MSNCTIFASHQFVIPIAVCWRVLVMCQPLLELTQVATVPLPEQLLMSLCQAVPANHLILFPTEIGTVFTPALQMKRQASRAFLAPHTRSPSFYVAELGFEPRQFSVKSCTFIHSGPLCYTKCWSPHTICTLLFLVIQLR